MLASKIICDDTYSNKSWCIVGQGMFALRQINQMERGMCSYLEWQLNVDYAIFKLESSLISPVQARIHQWYSPRTLLPTKVREVIKTQVWVPLFLHSPRAYRCRKTHTLFPVHRSEHTPYPSRYPRGFPLGLDAPAYRCRKTPPLFPVHRSEHTPHRLPIPQRPPTRPRPLPRHRFRRKRRPMLTGQDSLRLYR
jgi:hypothetical protein